VAKGKAPFRAPLCAYTCATEDGGLFAEMKGEVVWPVSSWGLTETDLCGSRPLKARSSMTPDPV
jgi:hypothetical protein